MTPPPFRPDAALLERYLAGECTPDERSAVHAWIDGEAQRRRTALGIKALDATRADRALAIDADTLFERVVARAFTPLPAATANREGQSTLAWQEPIARPTIKHPDARTTRQTFGKTRVPQRRAWPSAIALASGVLVAVFAWTSHWTSHAHLFGLRTSRSSLIYSTGNGERATITLPDGGTVALNVASRLEIPMDYLAGNHAVHLTGEGVFTVQHHAGTPLTVVAGPAVVRVLGTSFLVRKYATDSVATVAVRDGKVAIKSAVLAAAQQLTIGRTGSSALHAMDSAEFNFTRGILTLDSIPFPQAIVELDRWYDADIRLGDPRLATLRMTAEVGEGSLAELAYNLEHTYNIRVVRDGRVLTLYSGH